MTIIFSSPEFYLNQIEETIRHANDLQRAGTAIFSFFSGEEYEIGRQATVDSRHFEILFRDAMLSEWCQAHPRSVLKWIELMYNYFRSMSAIPEIAQSVLPWAMRIVEVFREYEIEALLASFQLASWDFFYGKENHPGYLQHIKSLPLKTKEAKLYRSLFNTTVINREQADFIESIKYTYKNRRGLEGKNLATAIISYYCHVVSQSEVLQELQTYLTGRRMRQVISQESCDFMKPLLWKFHTDNDYKSLSFLLRKLKGKASVENPKSSHGFLLSNGETLSILSTSGRDEFESKESYESYKALIRVSNRSTNTSISLLGEYNEDTSYFDQDRRGAPPIESDLGDLASAVIDHFKLHDSLYNELHSITLVPSHNFPIQSALFSLGRRAPIISTSLEDPIDDPETKSWIFFLSSNTATCNIEHEFIIKEFGANQEVIVDPDPELFASKLKSGEYNMIYISAHGEYNHWGESHADEIYFSEAAKIDIRTLKECSPGEGVKRNIILNICDGATTQISCNPYNRGIASTLAKGNQTVISHMWPVSTVYASAFGMLALHFIKSNTAIDTARLVYATLDDELDKIILNMRGLSASFSVLESYLAGKNFKMREFKNIGSVAVYS